MINNVHHYDGSRLAMNLYPSDYVNDNEKEKEVETEKGRESGFLFTKV